MARELEDTKGRDPYYAGDPKNIPHLEEKRPILVDPYDLSKRIEVKSEEKSKPTTFGDITD